MTQFVTGIDVSHYQQPAVMAQRAAAGDRFAIIKATDGRHVDKVMSAHNAAAGAVGLARGAYHFFRSSQDPVDQARLHLSATAEHQWELPRVCDYENESGVATPGQLLAFLDALEEGTGHTPILYTNAPFWRTSIGSDAQFARFPLWLASYPSRFDDATSVPTTFTVPAPAPWPAWSIWQFSDSRGRLDRNVMTPAELASLTTTHPAPAPEDQFMPKLTDDEQADLYAKVKELHADLAVNRAPEPGKANDNGNSRWKLGRLFLKTVKGDG